MKIREVMSRQIQYVQPNDTVRTTAEKMREFDVGAIPVIDGENCIGIVTDRDIALRSVAEGYDPMTEQIADIMSAGVVSCLEDDELEKATRIMEQNKVRRLLVVNTQGKPIGVVSMGDIAQNVEDAAASELVREVTEP
ncbi:CBS domain-containing protein [bacterium]|nr:CBS domain-containing protein [bacterium]